ncbi:hypothetical protein HFO86_34720 [Rhizobium leguminosarum]|uniref:hypothetical protein n=1 Tax=Rhizobium leguminosarum TaxID=384 RepID=UPI001C988726|nr:hypothetical protein [Rhizobium leguminosarum]MBY5475298.1 hypothetical protein [Rhizobium leguminosarum]
MPLIDVETTAFPPKFGFSPFEQILATWDDILWATITVGRPNIHYVFRYGRPSLYEALFRISMVRMALEQARPYQSHPLRRTAAFNALDPSEKGAVNYFLGMVFCKLFASSHLNIPWLLHVDVFKDQLSPAFLAGRSRPDLVGQDVTGTAWAAFESKGRISRPSYGDRVKAKHQARRIVSVDGILCEPLVASFTYFGGDTLRMICDDPEGRDSGERLRSGDDQWEHYYRPALTFAEGDSEDAPALERRSELDLTVEIHPKVLSLLREGGWSAAHNAAIQLGGLFRSEGFKPDGIKVTAGASWSEKLKL